MTSDNPGLSVPAALKRGALKPDEQRYIDSGAHLLQRIPQWLRYDSLAGLSVLDIGCGTKFTQAILRDDIDIDRYVGVDVYEPMIAHLRAEVSDSRFEFHHMNTHNEMYNPTGQPLTADTRLPCGEQTFDIICLFSVFTHLAPHDYRSMLKMLRPYIKQEGHILFSLYLDETSKSGHGLIDSIATKYGQTDWKPSGESFRDAYPGKPLQWALYSRDHALELIHDTGWNVLSVNDPEEHVQHFIVCSPA